MKHEAKISELKGQVFSSEDLAEILGSRQAIKYAEEAGLVSKITRGFYGVEAPMGNEFLCIAAKYFPDAIICGHTALFLQGLGDLRPDHIDMAVPRETNPSRNSDFFNFKRIADSKLVGIERKNIQGIYLKIFSPERCLFEAASGGPTTDDFLKAINLYIKNYKVDVDAISEIGESLPGKEIIMAAIKSVEQSRKF